jgi:hypothetical protein
MINVRYTAPSSTGKYVLASGSLKSEAEAAAWFRDRLESFIENNGVDAISYAAYLSDIDSKSDDHIHIWWYDDANPDNHVRAIPGMYWPGYTDSARGRYCTIS